MSQRTPPQPGAQAGVAQSGPLNPGKQRQRPRSHRPWSLQPRGHAGGGAGGGASAEGAGQAQPPPAGGAQSCTDRPEGHGTQA